MRWLNKLLAVPNARICQTQRLLIRRISLRDAAFVLALLNDPSFLRFIGDKGARTLSDARRYILDGPLTSYEEHGFGLYALELLQSGMPIGICGLVKRDALADIDIGFALMPEYRRQGYGFEASAAVLDHARSTLRIERVVAIVSADNQASMRLLEKLGLRFERTFALDGHADFVSLYVPAGPSGPSVAL